MRTLGNREVVLLFGYIREYIGKINAMVKKLEEVLTLADLLAFEKIRITISEAIKLDTEADNYRREIVEKYIPSLADSYVRENVRALVRMLDHVGQWIKSCLRYLDLVPLMGLPHDIRGYCLSLLKLARAGLETLRDSIEKLEKAKFDEAYQYGRKLEHIEEEADKVLHDAQRKIVEIANSMENVAHVIFVNEMLKSLETATDYEEDAGDIIRSLSLSLAKAYG